MGEYEGGSDEVAGLPRLAVVCRNACQRPVSRANPCSPRARDDRSKVLQVWSSGPRCLPSGDRNSDADTGALVGALEQPDLLVNDLRAFFRPLG